MNQNLYELVLYKHVVDFCVSLKTQGKGNRDQPMKCVIFQLMGLIYLQLFGVTFSK